MRSRWVDRDAKAAVDRYAAAGVSSELALRIYTTRLLGGDPALVLHGGGNTSLKTQMEDLAGETHEVLCVKGSGWDSRSSRRGCRRAVTRCTVPSRDVV
jgi:rhamnose utilization protein RhaD (predicted bifunctional aldolase and dehydrogenase)